ncbi:cysteine desulfurase [Parapedobacter sp. ISTM3]|uniref:cysteine desulfurase family protein n=1 Tax=Parapedobacter sp. ISTM3 TaxID=2800130 RepID=UPI001902F7B9|nr:cysteine desulfurase family protein [Parapedobacter sp. ISTM3]MBK1440434.1 cysteine desulfurase [Parapedobacter sp. ISTM3]
MGRRPIYLDYNATTPCDPRVVEAMLPYFTEQYGNAASADHRYGWQAKQAVEDAREQVARLISARPQDLVFTSGATESINLALKGIAEANAGRDSHIVTCKTEHKAVLDTCAYLETKGCRVTYLEVDRQGRIDIKALEASIGDDTICIALMYANNETGVIHPVKLIGAIARKHGVPFLCDATQAVGKIPVHAGADAIDLLVCSAHKLYGPKGIGALVVRNAELRAHVLPQQHGGDHEGGLRSGTLNIPGIVGFGKAAELCRYEMAAAATAMQQLRDRLEYRLRNNVPHVMINGHADRLPHVSNLLLPRGDAEQLLLSLSPYLALSRGSACSGLVRRPSHVLKAMGLSDGEASRTIRISLGRFTGAEEVDEAADRLAHAVLEAETVAD